jgi:hypothetical protein
VTRSSTPSSTALPPCPATVAGIRTIFHPNGPHQVTGVGNPPGLARRSDNAAGNAVPGLGLGNQLAAAGVAPPPGHDPLPGDRVKGVGGVGAAAHALRAPVTRPPGSQNRQLSGTGTRLSHPQTRAATTAQAHSNPCGDGQMQVRWIWHANRGQLT